MELVNETDLRAAHARARGIIQRPALLTADHNGATVRALQQAKDVQKRRLARAGGPDKRDGLARPDFKIGAAQHVDLARPLHEAAMKSGGRQGRSCYPLLQRSLTHTAGRRQGRDGLRARMGKASPVPTATAP